MRCTLWSGNIRNEVSRRRLQGDFGSVISARSCTPPTRSRAGTWACARRSRPAARSRPRTPPSRDVSGPQRSGRQAAPGPGMERGVQPIRAALGRSLPTTTRINKNDLQQRRLHKRMESSASPHTCLRLSLSKRRPSLASSNPRIASKLNFSASCTVIFNLQQDYSNKLPGSSYVGQESKSQERCSADIVRG